MKIFCTKDILLSGVNTVQKAVSSKNTLPILQGISIKGENNYLSFEATDLEIGIRCILPAQVVEEGTVVLPARLFSEIVRKLPDTTILLEQKSNVLNISYFESNISLKGYDPEEFPLLPDLYDPVSFNLPTFLFKNMVKQTIFSCSTEENRPVFTGVLLQIEEGVIKLVATDTHRLAYRTAKMDNNSEIKFSGIIPSKTLAEIYRLLKEEDELLEIQYSNSQIVFKFGAVYLISRLIDGQFPNYKQVIPQSCETKVHLPLRNFTEVVERASLLARDGSNNANIIRFNLENSVLRIDQTSELGRISEQMHVEMSGKAVSISFNSKYLLDVLKVLENEEIIFELSGSFSPGIIKPLNDPNYIYLVLPVRTS
ncbi:MAG: DNA polymerase III subunit beta [Desulfitobacterium hafniense]|nr:DNA polymerase III subunit beta [Desulfitobacterium hafniense]